MSLVDFFSGLSSATSGAKTIQSMIKNTRGIERTLLLELQKNISMLYLFVDHPEKYKTVINKLETRVYEEAVKSDFNFNVLKKTRVSARAAADVKQLQPYVGWTTEQLFENVHLKIHALKTIFDVDPDNNRFRIKIRLTNLHKVMILLLKHIKS